MDFTSLWAIIDSMLAWFFSPTMLATPTIAFCVDIMKTVLGFLGIYLIGIYPFVLVIKIMFDTWGVRKKK